MKRAVLAAFGALAVSGCATLIGASFDDAGLVEYDSGSDVHEGGLKFDVADSKPFDPSSLQYLVFWVDAHQQVDVNASNEVIVWHDLSGAVGRDATGNVSGYGTPTLAPTAINGQPGVHFVAASDQLLATGFAGPGSTQFTIFVVTQGYPQSAVRFQNGVSQLPLLMFPYDTAASESAPSFELYFASSSTDVGQARVTVNTAATIIAMTFRATGTITTYTNGTLIEQRLSTAASTSNAKLWIGGFPYPLPSIFTDGDIGEILVYDDALSDIDRSKVEGYLSVKWSIAL
jgi:hypothetical protein